MSPEQAKEYISRRFIEERILDFNLEDFINLMINELASKEFYLIIHKKLPYLITKVQIDEDGPIFYVR